MRALRSRLEEAGWGLDVTWVGAAGGLESRVAAREGIPFRAVATGKIRRARNPLKMASLANIRDMARVPRGMVQAARAVRSVRPDVVLATGGYVSVPVSAASWACRRPLVVHEQTTRLELANRIVTRGATRMAVTSAATLSLLPASVRGSAVVTGNPVRPEVLSGRAAAAFAELGWDGADPGLPLVYVTGGAQGSAQVVTALGKTAVLVPLASAAGDEQRHNARHLVAAGAAVALLEEVTPEALRAALEPLLADSGLRATIAVSARAQGRPDAAERLADTVLAAAGWQAG